MQALHLYLENHTSGRSPQCINIHTFFSQTKNYTSGRKLTKFQLSRNSSQESFSWENEHMYTYSNKSNSIVLQHPSMHYSAASSPPHTPGRQFVAWAGLHCSCQEWSTSLPLTVLGQGKLCPFHPLLHSRAPGKHRVLRQMCSLHMTQTQYLDSDRHVPRPRSLGSQTQTPMSQGRDWEIDTPAIDKRGDVLWVSSLKALLQRGSQDYKQEFPREVLSSRAARQSALSCAVSGP